jgi:polyhydroxyalkanoate synthesis regulator phasin
MIDLIKKALLTGVGFAVLTKEKAEELARDLAEQAKFSEQEGREFVDALMKQSETARQDFENRVSAAVGKAVNSLNLASRSEVDALKAQVASLEAKLATHQATSHPQA